MKKLLLSLTVLALVISPIHAKAAVTASASSLVTSPIFAKATSPQIGLFSLTLAQTASETLSSVAVTLNNNGTSTAASGDLAQLSVYKDNGDSVFNSSTDTLAGSQSTVNIGSPTVISTASNNAIDGGKFFISLATSPSWSSSISPIDSITASLAADGVVTSANSPVLTATTTSTITADTMGPVVTSAVAQNTGGGVVKNAGDKVVLTFGEATNKPVITAANIASILQLSNSHSWLDGLASIGGASWNSAGTELTITLSGGVSVPTVALSDTVTMSSSVITDATGNPAVGTTTVTGTFGEDTTGPAVNSAMAKNTGGTSAKEAGDSVVITFSEATNKFTITAANIASILQLNNSHSWLDGAASLGGVSWSSDGKTLTITLSSGTSLPTVAVGDTVTISGASIKDASNNNATGTVTITGDFGGQTGGTVGDDHHGKGDDDDDDDDEEDSRVKCTGGIINGKLYKLVGSPTVYLARKCTLKPFRGNAVFKARGHKFQNIIELSVAPTGVVLSTDPALPAEGTLIRGKKDKTVWFVTKDGKRRGFTKAEIFKKLGFAFDKVEIVDDSDLNTMQVASNIDTDTTHPDGSIIKCENATVVFEIKGGQKHAFSSAEAFNAKGHQFKHILSVDCSKFSYAQGAAIQ